MYSQEETLELEQRAAHPSGRLILVPKGQEKLKTRTLKVEGIVRDRFVVITCLPAARRDLGYQAFLGEISGNGNRVSGQASYYHIGDARLEAVEATYVRQDGE